MNELIRLIGILMISDCSVYAEHCIAAAQEITENTGNQDLAIEIIGRCIAVTISKIDSEPCSHCDLTLAILQATYDWHIKQRDAAADAAHDIIKDLIKESK